MPKSYLSFIKQLLENTTTTAIADDILIIIKDTNYGWRGAGINEPEIFDALTKMNKKYRLKTRTQLQRDIDDAIDFWSGSGEIMQDINGYWKPV